MLSRLIYASRSSSPLTLNALEGIVDTARRKNPQCNLTGLLAFDSQCFLQVLEGPRAALSELFLKIAADARHRDIELLELTAIEARCFGRWSMGFAAADARHAEMYLRHGQSSRFDPHAMTAAGALALLQALAAHQEPMRAAA